MFGFYLCFVSVLWLGSVHRLMPFHFALLLHARRDRRHTRQNKQNKQNNTGRRQRGRGARRRNAHRTAVLCQWVRLAALWWCCFFTRDKCLTFHLCFLFVSLVFGHLMSDVSNVQVAGAHYNDDTETDGEHSLCWQQVRVLLCGGAVAYA